MLQEEVQRTEREALAERFRAVRGLSRRLCQTLTAEDCCIQSMSDASPIRWHLAHTTWFFETFVLATQEHYQPTRPQYAYLFNSYYNTIGDQFPRSQRGLLSRPTVAEIWDYRDQVDSAVLRLFASLSEDQFDSLAGILELGLQHEQQHQELMLTDIKHAFSINPLNPAYDAGEFLTRSLPVVPWQWCEYAGGVEWIGHSGAGFAYDNESPRHRVFLESFALASRLVTAGEYQAFIEDGGYQRPELWLSEGWRLVQENRWQGPLYWRRDPEGWQEFTLAGLQPLDPQRPVVHVSYFEADAFARWRGDRLPTEAEWEVAAQQVELRRDQNGFVDVLLAAGAAIHPAAAPWSSAPQPATDGRATVKGYPGTNGQPAANGRPAASPTQLFGDVWEWTSSAYAPYPGYQPAAGALGEYNGKFMCNQYVLRGGSCGSSSEHLRASYRNFFPAATRWQFSGIRLARGC